MTVTLKRLDVQAHLPKKFKLLWRRELLPSAAAAGLPAHRGLKRVLWSLKFAVRVKGDRAFARSNVKPPG